LDYYFLEESRSIKKQKSGEGLQKKCVTLSPRDFSHFGKKNLARIFLARDFSPIAKKNKIINLNIFI